jgi:hypothetical protein
MSSGSAGFGAEHVDGHTFERSRACWNGVELWHNSKSSTVTIFSAPAEDQLGFFPCRRPLGHDQHPGRSLPTRGSLGTDPVLIVHASRSSVSGDRGSEAVIEYAPRRSSLSPCASCGSLCSREVVGPDFSWPINPLRVCDSLAVFAEPHFRDAGLVKVDALRIAAIHWNTPNTLLACKSPTG